MTRVWPCKRASSYCIVRVFGLTANNNVIEQVFTTIAHTIGVLYNSMHLYSVYVNTDNDNHNNNYCYVLARTATTPYNTYHTELGRYTVVQVVLLRSIIILYITVGITPICSGAL